MDAVQVLRQSLGPLPEPVAHPVLIALSGLPGTGKSYLARRLAERLPVAVLESDLLRRALFRNPSHAAAESAYLFQAVHRLLEELLRDGIAVLLDATNLEEVHRERLHRSAHRAGVRLILVRVKAPPEVVAQRLEGRAQHKDPQDRSDAGWEVYQRMRRTAEPVGGTYLTVETSRDVAPAVEKIVREVRRAMRAGA